MIDVAHAPKMDLIDHGGWPRCIRLSNGDCELIATTLVGPRILAYGRGGASAFLAFGDQLGLVGGTQWRNYGGHRLWHAPEARPRTYEPDNEPVDYTWDGTWLRLRAGPGPISRIGRSIALRMDPEGTGVDVVHALGNHGAWSVTLAPWALTVLPPGGVCIVPRPCLRPHPEWLNPVAPLVQWAYTDMADARWRWGTRYILLRQSAEARTPQKIGMFNPDGWAAYAQGGTLFVKRFPAVAGVAHADMGCNFEVFTDSRMIELESLGPLATLAPGENVESWERWELFDDVPRPEDDDQVDRWVLPRVSAALRGPAPV